MAFALSLSPRSRTHVAQFPDAGERDPACRRRLVDSAYVPGLATAILLYLPYCSWLFMRAVKAVVQSRVGAVVSAASARSRDDLAWLLYLFRGSRFF